ncbi:MAG: bifunctional nuclease family protein [Anaerolineae bacterium]|nr:bifunctional nuclease family protein [Anaerolineae bacterium]
MEKVLVAGLVNGEYCKVVVLLDHAGQRALPVGVEWARAWEIETALREQAFAMPTPFGFVTNLLKTTGAALEGVYISGLADGMLQVKAQVRSGGAVHEMPVKPADGVALAVTTGSPLYAAEAVLEKVAVPTPEPIKLSGPRGQLLDIEVLERIARAGADLVQHNFLGVHQITESLYLGSQSAMAYAGALYEAGVTRVLELSISGPDWPADFVVLENAINDRQIVPKARLESGVNFIREQIAAGHKVLVTCTFGVKRSPVLALAYLVSVQGYDLRDAWTLVRARHPSAWPSPELLESLLVHYELPYTLDEVGAWLGE